MRSPTDPTTFTLCLSGGGFRATFFHLGVVQYLSQRGLLGQVRSIVSISGGSILAAHLSLNWEAYSRPETFEHAAKELVAFGQSDVRGRLLRRWILLGWLPHWG